jgi:methyl-galactoside transport system substrate-binding protein
VIANNDDMALGAIEALKSAGYFKESKFMPVVGVDATVPAVKALKDGLLLGTVLNDAKNQGSVTVKIAQTLAEGKVPSKETIGFDVTDQKYVWIPYKKITLANVQEAM